MRKGLVILRPPLATPELQAQIRRILANDGWECELRTRFDGTMAVAFERPGDQPEGSVSAIEAQLKNHFMLSKANLEIREIG